MRILNLICGRLCSLFKARSRGAWPPAELTFKVRGAWPHLTGVDSALLQQAGADHSWRDVRAVDRRAGALLSTNQRKTRLLEGGGGPPYTHTHRDTHTHTHRDTHTHTHTHCPHPSRSVTSLVRFCTPSCGGTDGVS